MNSFNRRTAIRIDIVSTLLAAVASPVAWFVAHKKAEEATVSLAVEESRRLLHHFGAGARPARMPVSLPAGPPIPSPAACSISPRSTTGRGRK